VIHSKLCSCVSLALKLAQQPVWVADWGPVGIFVVCLLDSAFVPLPAGPDIAVIGLSALHPGSMPLYALAATAGSTIGCLVLYLIGRKGGEKALGRVKPERRARIENLLGRYDVLALIVPAMLPPPFPFKIFILSAGLFKVRIPRFIAAIFVGRGLRFLGEGLLAVEYGEDAGRIIARHGWKIVVAVFVVTAVWLAAASLRQRFVRHREAERTGSK
jgi:membrane protein YqaA with SNARE-associated domain